MNDITAVLAKERTSAPGLALIEKMTVAAAECGAVNLVQGCPDFDGPDALVHAACRAMANGCNQYSVSDGVLELRVLVAQSAADRGIGDYDPNGEIVVTIGGTAGLSAALRALIGSGDEVIFAEPFWHLYQPLVTAAGGVPVTFPLVWVDGRFEFDATLLRAAVRRRTRAILLNTPHNPTGKIFTRDELDIIASIAIENDLYIISDEVYEFLTFDDTRHESIAAVPGLRDRTIIVSSASKTLSVTGWRVGWVMGPRALMRLVLDAHILLSLCAPTPLQLGVVEALKLAMSTDFFSDIQHQYTRKRDLVFNALAKAGFNPALPRSGYFMLGRVPCKTADQTSRFCIDLIRAAGVAVLPAYQFFKRSSDAASAIRVSFCRQDAALVEAAERLKSWRSSESGTLASDVLRNSKEPNMIGIGVRNQTK